MSRLMDDSNQLSSNWLSKAVDCEKLTWTDFLIIKSILNPLAWIEERIWDFQIVQFDRSRLIGDVNENDETQESVFGFELEEAMRVDRSKLWYQVKTWLSVW